MKVILAEKPSVARDIANFLGAKSSKDGYFEGNGYQVTWAFGHLVVLKDPEEYDPSLKKWSLSTLPIIPPSFQLKLLADSGVVKQFGIIKRLFTQGSELICATDAGREGELIFRYILSLIGFEETKPFFRLWLSSLTEEAIGKAFKNLKPGHDFDNLYAAARCRSESDWIVGLNATRNFTVRYGKGSLLWSVGRVQTPVLAMIVERDDEIRQFRSTPFWELKTNYKDVLFKYTGERFLKEAEAQEVLQQIENHPLCIEDIQAKKEKVNPPLLYDLTELQRDMNKCYGLSAQETLEIAQSLYEQKYISYPRTDSRFLGTDMKTEVPKILDNLLSLKPVEIGALDLSTISSQSKIFNDKKTGEHHAIIPTGKMPGPFSSSNMGKVFDKILIRLLAALSPPCLKDVTIIEALVNTVPFQARGVYIKEPGWTTLYSKEKTEEDENKEQEQKLPSFQKKESGPHQPFLKEGKTEPPRPFTEATLLGAMETAGKLVSDEELKEALKQKGLGTPATRASIIETLLKRNYIAREKKSVQATNLGRYLIALIQNSQLKSAELTGEWECKLKKIEEGSLSSSAFMEEISQYTKEIIEKSRAVTDLSKLGNCPLCGHAIIEGKKGYGCSQWKEGCNFVLWKEYPRAEGPLPITRSQAQILLQHRFLPIDSLSLALYLSSKGLVFDVPIPSQSNRPNFSKSANKRKPQRKK